MNEALQVEWNSEMNNPAAITCSGLSASPMSDPGRAKDLPRVTKRRTSKRSPSLKGKVPPTQAYALRQSMLQELFLKSRYMFVRIAYGILGNNEDAEDAVQDAFVSACRHLREFEGRSALTTWFTRIVINAALMMRRRRKNAARWASPETDAEMSSFVETIPDSQPDPELAYSRAEALKILEVHLKKINPLLRDAIMKTYYDELSLAEASSAVAVPPTTYKARLFRGKRLLQQRAARITRVTSVKPKKQIQP